jgi:hypothetical protein
VEVGMSIRTLVLIVACIAFDCGVFRAALVTPLWGGGPWIIGALGFINALAVAAARLAVHRGGHPFLIGFVVCGTVALALFLGFCAAVPWSLSHRLDGFIGDTLVAIPSLRILADRVDQSQVATGVILAIAVLCFNAIISTPLTLIALAGGWLAARSSKRRGTTTYL